MKYDAKSIFTYCCDYLSGLPENELEAKYIVSDVLNISFSDIFLRKNATVSLWQLLRIKHLLTRRKSGQPIQYVLGNTEFFGYHFFCDRRALIPRPETEILCEQVLSVANKNDRVLDLCTGTGCIGITLKKQNESLTVTCSDISKRALKLAEKNKNHHAVDITLIKSDLFDNVSGDFDIVVSNPPYINEKDFATLDKKVLDHEPKNALVSGSDGLDLIRVIIRKAYDQLNPFGYLLLEIGYDQREKVENLLSQSGYKEIIAFSDYANFDRIVMARKIV